MNAYTVNYEIDPAKVIALVNIGFDFTNLTFIKDGIYHSTRDVPGGGRSVSDNLVREFQLDSDVAANMLKGLENAPIDEEMYKVSMVGAVEELLGGLEVAFSYFRSSAKVERIDTLVLSGGGALIPHLAAYMEERLSTPVEVMNPLRRIERDPDFSSSLPLESVAPMFTVAVGLACRGS